MFSIYVICFQVKFYVFNQTQFYLNLFNLIYFIKSLSIVYFSGLFFWQAVFYIFYIFACLPVYSFALCFVKTFIFNKSKQTEGN